MGDSLFDIFGDRTVRQTLKNVRQPMCENMGKMAVKQGMTPSRGPLKPNEPVKKGDSKKSFLSNKGLAIQGTPVRTPFTPCKVNVGSMIYNDFDPKTQDTFDFNEVEFTKPTYLYDNYQKDALDHLLSEECQFMCLSPPATPPPADTRHFMDFSSSDDDLYSDDFSNEEIIVDDLGLPDLY